MRVITRFGLGRMIEEEKQAPFDSLFIQFDTPLYDGTTLMWLNRRSVFFLSSYALVRVVNISGAGTFSNLQFHNTYGDAEKHFLSPIPGDETRFLLDFSQSWFRHTELRIGVEKCLWLTPWINRWGREESAKLRGEKPTLEEFDAWQKHFAGTGAGIFSPVFLDVERKKILRFCIDVEVPLGIVYELTNN